MTPEEAKKKWCPMAKTAGGNNRWSEAGLAAPVTCLCLADGCMLWQWAVSPKGASTRMGANPDGYCGLGRP